MKHSEGSRFIRNVKAELESLAHTLFPIFEDTTTKDDDDLKAVVSELTTSNKKSMGKAIRFLTSHIKVTCTFRCNIHNTNRGHTNNVHVPVTIDNGADTFMFGSDFRIF